MVIIYFSSFKHCILLLSLYKLTKLKGQPIYLVYYNISFAVTLVRDENILQSYSIGIPT